MAKLSFFFLAIFSILETFIEAFCILTFKSGGRFDWLLPSHRFEERVPRAISFRTLSLTLFVMIRIILQIYHECHIDAFGISLKA